MNVRLRFLFLFLVAAAFSLPALALNPKGKPGVNEGTCEGSGTGNNEGSDLKLPIGIPFQYTDGNSIGGGSSDNTSHQPARIVYSFDLTDDIGPASLRQTHTALEQARAMNAACVLIRINSYTGALSAAQQIREELLAFDRPIIIYVEDKAISAAALISLAGDSLYMRKGSNISQVTNAKQHAQVKKQVGAHHNAKQEKKNDAAAAVTTTPDQTNGTMNSAEAVRRHVANAEASDMKEVLARAGLDQYAVVYYSPGFFEQMIDLLMRPLASLLLVVFIAFGIRLQRSLPFPGPVTFLLLVSLSLFCVPLFEGGLAHGAELMLLLLPLILSIAGPLKNSSSRLLRLSPVVMLVFVLSLCQSGSLAATPVPELSLNLLFTSAAFVTGWSLPLLATKAARLLRLPSLRRKNATATA